MTTYELEVAAYAAAHRIYNGLGQPDRPCPGGYRSAAIDKIAQAIKDAFSVHRSSVRGRITGTVDVDAMNAPTLEPLPVPRCTFCNIPVGGQHRPSCHRQGLVTPDSDHGIPGLIQTRYWRQLRHAFDMGGGSGTPDRPCLKCGMLYPFDMHYAPSGEPLQSVNVEPAASGEAAISGEAKP